MVGMLQDILLSRWVVGFMLLGAFVLISRWSLLSLKEYPGYALGVLMGLFFIMVYIALGGGANPSSESEPETVRKTLNIFEVFVATFFGLLSGAGIMAALRLGSGFARGVALQVALYTAINLILLFLAIIAGPITQRMIGLYGLAIGIASLFAMVLFPGAIHQLQATADNAQAQGGVGGNPPKVQSQSVGSRLDDIRNKMRQRDQQR